MQRYGYGGSNKYLVYLLTVPFILCALTDCCALGEDRFVIEGQALKILEEAQKSALEMLHSAKGIGRYLLLQRPKEDGELRPITKAHVVVLFAGVKYHIDLDYEIDQLNAPRRKILYDGKIVLQSTFGDDILPLHARGEVCETTGKFENPAAAGFPWNPARLPSEVLDFATLAKAGVTLKFKIKPQPAKDIEGQYHWGKIRGVFYAGPATGYNVSRLDLFNADSSKLAQRDSVEWENKKGVWFVKEFVREMFSPYGAPWRREELHYDSFEPNVQLTDGPFQIGSLELPPGARILDHRPGAPPRQFFYSASAQTNQADLDELLAKLHAPRPAESGQWAPRAKFLWAAAIACCLILGGLLVLIARRRRRSAGG